MICGVSCLVRNIFIQFLSNFKVTAVLLPILKIVVTAIVVPCVFCDLSIHPISFDMKWNHLSDVQHIDPSYGHPGKDNEMS